MHKFRSVSLDYVYLVVVIIQPIPFPPDTRIVTMSSGKDETIVLIQSLLDALPEDGLYETLAQMIPSLLYAYAGPEAAISDAAGALLLDGASKSQRIKEAIADTALLQTILQACEERNARHGVQLKLLTLLQRIATKTELADMKDAIRVLIKHDPTEEAEDVLYVAGLIQYLATLSQLTRTGRDRGLSTLRDILQPSYESEMTWLLTLLNGEGPLKRDSMEDELVCVEVLRFIAQLPGTDCSQLAQLHNLLDIIRSRLHSQSHAIRENVLNCLAALFPSMTDEVWSILPPKIGRAYLPSLGLLLERAQTDAWKTRILEEKCPADYLLQLFEGLSSTFEVPRKISYYHFHQLATWQQGTALVCGSDGVLALLMSGKGDYADIVAKHEIMRKVLETLKADDGCGRDISGGHRRAIEAFVNAGSFGQMDDGSMRIAAQSS